MRASKMYWNRETTRMHPRTTRAAVDHFRAASLGLVVSVLSASAAVGQITFDEISASANLVFNNDYANLTLHSQQFQHGVAVADYDNDGWLDVYLSNGYQRANFLFHNDGDGTFTEVAASVGADLRLTDQETKMALWVDYDADGWLDLLALNEGNYPSDPGGGNCQLPPLEAQSMLFRNLGDGTFEDVTEAAQVPSHPYTGCNSSAESYSLIGGAAAGDLTGDGFPEIYVAYWRDVNSVWLNNGDGTFSDISVECGVQLFLDLFEAKDSWTPLMWDINEDGRLDVLQNIDFTENVLFLNQGLNASGIPTFVDGAEEAGLDTAFNEMGQTVGDVDNDGDFDLYITNLIAPAEATDNLSMPDSEITKWNRFFINNSIDGDLHFVDRAELTGDKTMQRTGWGWGCTFFDYNHDGFVDLAVANGNYSAITDIFDTDKLHLFRNNGDGSFTEQRDVVGFNDDRSAKGCVAFDFDRDGDLDVLVTNTVDPQEPEPNESGRTLLYENVGGRESGNWIVVNPIGAPPNDRAIGAVVHLQAEGIDEQMRLLTSGTSFLSQEPDEAHFGIANADHIESIRVVWLGGEETVLTEVPDSVVNGWINVRQNLNGMELGGLRTVEDDGTSAFTTTLVYSDGRLEDVTEQTVWTVEPGDFASINAAGVLTTVDILDGTSQTITLRAEFEHLSSEETITIFGGEVVPPTIAISSPDADMTTEVDRVTVTGTASGIVALTAVTWSNTAGGGGPCAGTLNWSTGPITLVEGLNVISVSATDELDNSTIVSRAITYQPAMNENENEGGNENLNTNTQPNDNEVTNGNTEPNLNTEPNVNTPEPNDNDVSNENTPEPDNDNRSPVGPPPSTCGLFGFVGLACGVMFVELARYRRRRIY